MAMIRLENMKYTIDGVPKNNAGGEQITFTDVPNAEKFTMMIWIFEKNLKITYCKMMITL